MRQKITIRRGKTNFLIVLAILLATSSARAQLVNLETLRGDGYGVVALKRPKPNVLCVDATLNGHKVRLIVDTGWSAPGITLQKEFLSTLRLPAETLKGSGTTISGATISDFKLVRSGNLQVGNVELAQVPILLANIAGIRDASARKVGADGFLGSRFLQTCSAIIDLQNLRLYLRPPGHGRKAVLGPALRGAGLSEASFKLSPTHDCMVDIEINGVPGTMILDTGAYLAVIDKRLASKLKARAYSSRVGSVDAAGIQSQTGVALLHSFKIGGVNVRAPDVRVQELAFYARSGGKVTGLLGMDILGSNGTVIDFGVHKLFFLSAR